MGTKEQSKGMQVSVKSFITALVILFLLMVLTYGLTFIIPGGEYGRIVDENGNTIVDVAGGFRQVEGGIPFWKWLLSPFLVLGAEGNGSLIAIIAFLLVIGGVFNSLDRCGLMRHMLQRISERFRHNRYGLMALIVLFFMGMGSFVGSFEECVPLVPIVVALSVSLGWNPLVGVGMSILAAGCGFAAGICNPFTVGVAQELAGLPMFSGMWFRMISFGLIYGLLLGFLVRYSKKIERVSDNAAESVSDVDAVEKKRMDRGAIVFASVVGAGILVILSSAVMEALRDYVMIIVALMFLAAGIGAVLTCGMSGRHLGGTFLEGLIGVFPAVLLILMANAIKYIMMEAHILDTVLHGAVAAAGELPYFAVILFIYLIVLGVNFFIPSGSAKAFLLMPLIVPVAQTLGISSQLCVAAFIFGDGFSNAFYPTNPVLLLSLGLADVNYGKWAKWSFPFQAVNFLLTAGLLMVGLAVGY